MSLLNTKQRRREVTILDLSKIKYIEQKENQPAVIHLEASEVRSTCLQCVNPKCIKVQKNEMFCAQLEDFPGDRVEHVCPQNAIEWDYKNELPLINKSKCISCALCAMRCPAGAIYFNGTHMDISVGISEVHCNTEINQETLEIHEKNIQLIPSFLVKRKFIHITPDILTQIYTDTRTKVMKEKTQNIFIRNLLIQVGATAAISRIGDVYNRMDGVYVSGEHIGAIEVEFGTDSLDASRSILDDIAVLQTRYGLSKEKQTPLVVCLSLPNKRQGYFQVLKDIKNVLGIEIRTVTLGTLLLLAWSGNKLYLNNSNFYVDFDNLSLRDYFQLDIDELVDLQEGELGILEPQK